MLENALDLEGLGYYHSKITEKIDTKAEQTDLETVETLLGDTDISAIGDGTVTGGLETLFDNMLKAETLDNYSLGNITADTEELFLKSVAQKIVEKGVTAYETISTQVIWQNNAHYHILCTNLNNTFYMLVAFGSSGQFATMRYNTTDGTYLYKPIDLSKYLSLTDGGTLDGIVTMNKQLRIAGGVSPTSDNSQLLGSGNFTWANVCARIHALYRNGIDYGAMSAAVEGTESAVGIGRLTLGNNTAQGTAGNAMGYIQMYGKGSGLTHIYPSNESATSNSVYFPKESGTLALLSDISETSLDSLGITATADELNYMDGVTSNVQTQLNGKASSSHTHNVLSVQADNYKQGTDLPSTYPRGETIFLSNNPTNKFNNTMYCTIHTIKGYTNMACIQFLYPYNTNADTIYYRTAVYNTDAWRDWQTISVSGHTHNYAGSSSAGGAATTALACTGNSATATSASSSASNVGTSCLRNMQASTTDLVAGTSALATGQIYIVYE